MVGHAGGGLGIGRAVEVVVVDVEDGIGVRLAGSLEGDADEVFSKDLGEDGLAERAILVEHLVDDVLAAKNNPVSFDLYRKTKASFLSILLTQARILPFHLPTRAAT